jgi:microcin C transport system substrate-binding protein
MMRVLTIALGLMALSGAALAEDAKPLQPAGDWMTGISIQEAPRMPPGFAHFNYVNPDAPKGGVVRLGSDGTFDTLNPILPKGVQADGLGLIYETLFTRAYDELDIGTAYPQIADAVRYPPDFSYVIYRINPKAKWHDGTPITADDVVWSFDKTMELNDGQRNYYRHVVKAEKTAPDQVTFTFDEAGNRELPLIVSELTILPQHWWEGKDANGKQRDISASTLEPPMGSGPYAIDQVIPSRSISYKRVPDFWGKDLNTYIGQNNFDAVRYEYFRDLNVQFEAFKADQFDYWPENEAKRWNTAYDFPAINAGKVKKETVNLDQVSGVMVGFIPNLRRPFFQDARVRKALNLVFNFEELNRTIFYGQYQRINSFFFGLPSMTAATGLPTGRELELLNSVKDQVPADVFTTPYVSPDNGDATKVRANLQQALALFKEAGYELKGNQMIGKDGKPVEIEVMLNGPTIERVALPYSQWLAKIGIKLTVRSVDTSQFVERVRKRDFDLVYSGWGQSNSPGNEQIDMWSSQSADRQDSRNYAGIKDPAVDTLINAIVFNKGREDQIAAVRALDRVMMSNLYVIPSYTYLPDRIAYWDRFGHPEGYGKFTIGFPTIWWWDKDKAAKTGGSSAN